MIRLKNLIRALLEADDLMGAHNMGVSEPDYDTMAWPPEDADQEHTDPTPDWPMNKDGENG